MKKTIYALAIIATLFTSCKSDDDVNTSVFDENLVAISTKLQKLKTSDIQDRKSEGLDFEIEGPQDLLPKTKSIKTLKTDLISDCKHKEMYFEEVDGEKYEETTLYFDIDGNESTSCEAFGDNTNYITEKVSKITGESYVYDFLDKTIHVNSNIIKDNVLNFKLSQSSMLTGTLNFDGDVFKIIDGSRIDFSLEYTINLKERQDINSEVPPIKIDVLYKFEFIVKSETYHFDMVLSEDDFDLIEEGNGQNKLEMEYDLLDNSNKKIGTIKYISEDETEKFEIYDLDGVLV